MQTMRIHKFQEDNIRTIGLLPFCELQVNRRRIRFCNRLTLKTLEIEGSEYLTPIVATLCMEGADENRFVQLFSAWRKNGNSELRTLIEEGYLG